MRLGISLAWFVLCQLACSPPITSPPEIGDFIKAPSSEMFLLGQGEHINGVHQSFGDVSYFVGLHPGGEVHALATLDPKFKTPEGFSLSSSLAEIQQARNSLVLRGAGNGTSIIELPSGWVAVFLCSIPSDLPRTSTPIRFCRYKKRLTLRSSRTPPALPSALSQHFAISAPFSAPVQAWPLSFIR